MSRAEETAGQRSFIDADEPVSEPSAGPVATPPALRISSGPPKRKTTEKEADATQLPLPLDPEPSPGPAHPVEQKRPRGKRRGFVRVTRDPDVARAYSDHADLSSAIAQGLAQALASLPPEELAALRARVAEATRKNERHTAPRGDSGELRELGGTGGTPLDGRLE